MRRLLFIILIAFSFGVQADNTIEGPRMTLVPYIPVLADSISMADDTICSNQALVGAKALQNAKHDVTQEEQLRLWDAFANSTLSAEFPKAQLDKNRKIIIMAWQVSERYPTVTPNEFGDMIYGACASNKSLDRIES